MTEDELCELCREWQGILRLQDWDIEVRVVNLEDLDGHYGDCKTSLVKRTARIRVALPEASVWVKDSEVVEREDLETCVVHELMHVMLRPMHPEDPGAGNAEEQACHFTAQALVALKRRARDAHVVLGQTIFDQARNGKAPAAAVSDA